MGREWYKIQEKVIETVPDSSFLLVQSTPNGKGALNKINFITTGDFILSPPISSLILSIIGPHTNGIYGGSGSLIGPTLVTGAGFSLSFDINSFDVTTVGNITLTPGSGLILDTGGHSIGDVLTSDGIGTATWQTSATEDLETTLAAGNFTGANDIVLSTQLSTRIIRSDNATASKQMALCFFDGGVAQDVVKLGDPLLTEGGLVGLGPAGANLQFYTALNAGLLFNITASGWNFQTYGGATPGDVTLGSGIGLELTYAGGTGVLRSVAGLTTETWDLPAESGILPVGEGWNTIIANAAAPEDGKVIAWDDGNSEYTLLAASVNTNIYTHDGTTGAGRTVTLTDTLQFIGGQVDVTAGTTDTGATVLSSEKADTTNIVEFNDRAQGRVNSGAFITSAQFEVASSTRGFLPPRNADPLANIPGPVEGLIAWDSTDNELQVFDSANWITLGDLNNPKRTWNWGAARNASNVTNQYIRTFNGTVTNLCPYVVPFDCILTDLTCSTRDNETWVAEVREDPRPGGAETVIASISVGGPAANQGSNIGLSVALSAGDEIGFYCNGIGISYPHIQAWFRET